jgi:putative FmdB family regulatory protein
MPTYEYECSECGHRLEEIQSIKAKPLTACPVCKKRKLRRLISGGAGFLFKGSGFYITDYRSENYKEGAKKESGAAAVPSKANGSEATPAKAAAPAKAAEKTAVKTGG